MDEETAGIRTPDQRLRVFVSSTLGELADERAAAREAIEGLRLTPVMFELGARPHPPRALYRAYLEQSDVFVGIYWQRYGWVGPDMEISGLEDEFRLGAAMPRLMYLKRPAPEIEPRLKDLLTELQSEDVSYKSFADAGELRVLLADDLVVMLTERFAAPSAPGSPLAAPPQPVTRLVGRDEEVERLIETLTDGTTRLVTLTGVGGIGKTRLALAVAERTRDRWTDGVAWVDLTTTLDPARVLDAVAAACGVRPEGTEPALEAIVRRLAGKRMLLLLDNFEQVVAAGDELAELLHRCPHVHVVVTSRAVLRLRGEREWPVLPLALPSSAEAAEVETAPATSLLIERARDVRRSFDVTPRNAAAIAELSRRLDGLPLALELASAQLRMLSPEQVLERLGSRLDLAGGFADLPERQQTLAATLDWSYGLLTPSARRLLERASVFRGAFTLDAVEAVCGWDADDVVEDLSTLVDHSLVSVGERPDGEPGFRMLEIVRTYASARLDTSGDRDRVFENLHERLMEVFGAEAPRLHTAEQTETVLRLDGEVGNLFAVLGWLIETGRSVGPILDPMGAAWVFWQIRVGLQRLPDLSAVLEGSPSARAMTPRDWAMVHWMQAGRLFTSSRYEELTTFGPKALAAWEEIGDPKRAGMLQLILAVSRPYDPDGPARAEFESAAGTFRAAGDMVGLAYARSHQGDLFLNDGDVAAAKAAHAEALSLGRSLGDVNMQAESHYHLAVDSVRAGELDEAREHLRLAVARYRDIDSRAGTGYVLACLAGLALAEDAPERAAQMLGACDAVRRPLGLIPWPQIAEIEQGWEQDARAALSDEVFERELVAGRGLKSDDALELGLERIDA